MMPPKADQPWWAAVILTALLAAAWGWWGITENFHEGWYHERLVENLTLMVGQYLAPMLVVIALGLVSIRWHSVALGAHLAVAIAALWFFHAAKSPVVILFVAVPLLLLGWGYRRSPSRGRVIGAALVVVIPLSCTLASGVGPALRVAQRYDDGQPGVTRLTSSSVDLLWAPPGPGWPATAISWGEATERAAHLSADGSTLLSTRLGIWRLPTAAEIVASQVRHGRLAGGRWDPVRGTADYAVTPDKESPLWDPHSPIIYWWTSDVVDDSTALIAVYNGQVRARPKTSRPGTLAFRAVRATGSASTSREPPRTREQP